MTDSNRFPALAAWQRRWCTDPASHERFDLLWRLACLEAQAEELARLDMPQASEAVRLKARQVASEETAA